MWGEIFRAGSQCLGILCVGFAVKLMDDALDGEISFENLYKRRENNGLISLMPYILLLLCFACVLSPRFAPALFLASYVVGMFHDHQQLLPTRLTAWKESLVVALFSIVFLKGIMLFALVVIFTVQLLDDYIDYVLDKKAGRKNFVFRFGKIESILLLAVGILLSFWLQPAVTSFVFFTVFCVNTVATTSFYPSLREGEKQ